MQERVLAPRWDTDCRGAAGVGRRARDLKTWPRKEETHMSDEQEQTAVAGAADATPVSPVEALHAEVAHLEALYAE